ncbi:MAG: hypothetical protein LLG45_11055 [Actinomycetia bacterium]|nr:hypothetical protein [Actinomycetes bacterium]
MGPTGRKSRTGLVLGVVAAAIIVLAGAGVGAYYAFFRDEGGTQTTTTSFTGLSRTTERVTTSTGGPATSGPETAAGAHTTQTIPRVTTSTGPTAGSSTTEDIIRPYLRAADDLVAELAYDDTRIPELAAEINRSAPGVPDWVRDELSTMLGLLDAFSMELASLDVPPGFEEPHQWLEEAAMHMGNRIDATIQGIEATWDAGKVDAVANDFFDKGRKERDAYREAMDKYYEALPIE